MGIANDISSNENGNRLRIADVIRLYQLYPNN